MTVAETLRVAEKLLRSNRYLAEADMCKEAADTVDSQARFSGFRSGYAEGLQAAADAVENYKGTVVLVAIASEIRKLPLP